MKRNAYDLLRKQTISTGQKANNGSHCSNRERKTEAMQTIDVSVDHDSFIEHNQSYFNLFTRIENSYEKMHIMLQTRTMPLIICSPRKTML